MSLLRTTLDTPIGPIFFIERDDTVVAAGFTGECDHAATLERYVKRRFREEIVESPTRSRIAKKLEEYLAGDLSALDAIAVDAEGTEFEKRVWRALRTIPAGATASYAEIARAVGSPTAVRAVGAANAKNPISVIVPCHRVIRSDGSLCGYAGGIHRKQWLLAHESGPLLTLT
jgi:methylated-DNA-[protein]-cysteine S-methyltransferase